MDENRDRRMVLISAAVSSRVRLSILSPTGLYLDFRASMTDVVANLACTVDKCMSTFMSLSDQVEALLERLSTSESWLLERHDLTLMYHGKRRKPNLASLSSFAIEDQTFDSFSSGKRVLSYRLSGCGSKMAGVGSTNNAGRECDATHPCSIQPLLRYGNPLNIVRRRRRPPKS